MKEKYTFKFYKDTEELCRITGAKTMSNKSKLALIWLNNNTIAMNKEVGPRALSLNFSSSLVGRRENLTKGQLKNAMDQFSEALKSEGLAVIKKEVD